VWAFLRHTATSALPKSQEKEALAFIEQAFDFFEAAASPRIGSRPLLYYYSFLNLAKVLLLIRKVNLPVKLKHGISDPDENTRKRLQLSGQRVHIVKCARDHSQLFPEFVRTLGGEIHKPCQLKVVSLLRQVPGIHRTFCRITKEKPSFLPVKQFDLLRDQDKIFARIILSKTDTDVQSALQKVRSRTSFKRVFRQVWSGNPGEELWFETEGIHGVKRATDTAIGKLAEHIQKIGIWAILTSQGYRYYLSKIPPGEMLPPLASIYAVMFYLGSITRYKPYDFDRIVSQRFSWLVGEFLRTQPTQFLYCLAGHVAGVDVVRPFASLD
jgi:hypothetical protein